MAELADAYGSGPYEGNFMEVQVLLSAPSSSQARFSVCGEFFISLLAVLPLLAARFFTNQNQEKKASQIWGPFFKFSFRPVCQNSKKWL